MVTANPAGTYNERGPAAGWGHSAKVKLVCNPSSGPLPSLAVTIRAEGWKDTDYSGTSTHTQLRTLFGGISGFTTFFADLTPPGPPDPGVVDQVQIGITSMESSVPMPYVLLLPEGSWYTEEYKTYFAELTFTLDEMSTDSTIYNVAGYVKIKEEKITKSYEVVGSALNHTLGSTSGPVVSRSNPVDFTTYVQKVPSSPYGPSPME